jgi:hypothetical protein
MTVNGVSADEGSHALDALADAAGLDMRDWFTPTAENYLGSLPKVRILDVVRDAVSPEVGSDAHQFEESPAGGGSREADSRNGMAPRTVTRPRGLAVLGGRGNQIRARRSSARNRTTSGAVNANTLDHARSVAYPFR